MRAEERHWIEELLERVQQRCPRTVTGVFKATSRSFLEKEAAVAPLRAHIAHLQLQTQARLEVSGARREISEACDRIR